MTKAEKTAKAWVEKLWVDIVDPGEAWPNMDAKTFDIENLLDAMLPMSYARKVPEVARMKAFKLARRLWDERLKKKEQTNANLAIRT